MYLRFSTFIITVLVMHVLLSANWNRHTIKSIFIQQDGTDRNNV